MSTSPPRRFGAKWFLRGLRLAVVVGIVSAEWMAWEVWSRYAKSRSEWYELQATIACGASRTDAELRAVANEFGNYNLRDVNCVFDRDFIASPKEIEESRNGTWDWHTMLPPAFNSTKTIFAGVAGFIGTLLLTAAGIGLVKLWRWVWGKQADASS